MLSDSCHQIIFDILTAVSDYDYSDEHKDKLIKTIMRLNEIRDSLDKCLDGNQLTKRESKRIAIKMYENAQRKRMMSSVDFFDGVYD